MKSSLVLFGSILSLVNSQPTTQGQQDDVVPGKYIVKYRKGVKRTSSNDRIMSSQKSASVYRIGEAFEAVESDLDDSLKEWVEGEVAKGDSGIVEYYEPVKIVRMTQQQCPNSQRSPVSWGQKRVTVNSANDVGSSFHHDSSWGSGVDAYILDTGIRCSHEEFEGRCIWGANFASGSSNTDRQGHGTHVAGTVAGKTYGVAKSATVIAVKVLGDDGYGTTAGIIQGIQWVVDSVRRRGRPSLINMSLGGSSSRSENDAVESAFRSGVSFAVAAGNDNSDACTQSPASAPSAVTVASSTSRDSRSSFSNWGSCTDIFAPGSSITSAGVSWDSATDTMSGTSMASPHVAGAMAVYLGMNPSASPRDVTNWLVSNAGNGYISNTAGSPNRMLHIPCDGSTPPTPPTPPSPPSPPTPPTPPSGCSDQTGCYGTSCDYWLSNGYTCASLTSCDCTGCSMCGSVPAPTPPPAQCTDTTGCYGKSCDYWISKGYGCNSLTACDCTGCDNCGSAPPPTPPMTPTPRQGCRRTDGCYGESCDYWAGHGYTCSTLESVYGCDCTDCSSCSAPAPTPAPTPAPAKVCSQPTGCSRRSCDYWVSFGYTCSNLERNYGCDCSGCQC